MVCALALMTLSACGHFGQNDDIRLAQIPTDIIVCFHQVVPAPPPGEMTRAKAMRLIADLKRSEMVKTACGQRLIAWYETQRKVFEASKNPFKRK